MVSPGLSAPRASASRIIPSAVRSLIEPPGFAPSSLIHTSAIAGVATRSKRTTGVRPITASTRWPATTGAPSAGIGLSGAAGCASVLTCSSLCGRSRRGSGAVISRRGRRRRRRTRTAEQRLHPGVADPARPRPDALPVLLLRHERVEQPLECIRHFVGRRPEADTVTEGAVLPEPAADEEIESLDLHPTLVQEHPLQ